MQLSTFGLRAHVAQLRPIERVMCFDVYQGTRNQYTGMPYPPGHVPNVETSGKPAYRVRVTFKDNAE